MRWRRRLAAATLLAGVLFGSAALVGCANLSHWSQAVSGHLGVLRAARPVDEVLADPATPALLAERLRLTQQMRRFATERLALPDNSSYTRYADLGRNAAVWNAVAAPEFGFTLKTWCYPLMGCAGYRGYFDLTAARAEVEALRQAGWDAQVIPVPAYSTLGWSGWLGGDPLLNTFVQREEGELAAQLFHELAHQKVYVADDTGFNEAYASAVELLGARQWLAAKPEALAAFEAGRAQRESFLTQARALRDRLGALYALDLPLAEKRARKQALLRSAQAPSGYERWFAAANNANLALLGAYEDLVPGFVRLFERCGGDWPRFHAAVAALAPLSPVERRARLASDAGP